MLSARIISYISIMNIFIAILGFVKTENYWQILSIVVWLVVYILCFVIEYRSHKDLKASQAIIDRSLIKDSHYCNVLSSNVVCFEIVGELWVKEYCSGNNIREGRTYMVYHCPWCGYQTEKSKIHEKVKICRKSTSSQEKI